MVLRLFPQRMFVITDPSDNSVTLSKAVFSHLRKHSEQNIAKVIVFRLSDTQEYAFAITDKSAEETQICDIQFNEKYNCIGFESLCPTVVRILYDYGLPNIKTKLSIGVRKIHNHIVYIIRKPTYNV